MFWVHILFYKTCGPIANAILNSVKELNIRYTLKKFRYKFIFVRTIVW